MNIVLTRLWTFSRLQFLWQCYSWYSYSLHNDKMVAERLVKQLLLWRSKVFLPKRWWL
jgi:hypothetical protein